MRLAVLALLLAMASPVFGKMPYDAVCSIHCPDGSGGSGTLVAKLTKRKIGLILTEAHVMPQSTEVTCTWPAYKVSRKAKPIVVSYMFDTALLLVSDPPGDPVPIALDEIEVGDELYSVGFPWYSRDKLCWQKGVVEKIVGVNAETSSRPAAGMSGGAVFNKRGSLAGTVKALQSDDTGGIIVASIVKTFMFVFQDETLWKPITSHLVDPKTLGPFAPHEKPENIETYSEETAPDLGETK